MSGSMLRRLYTASFYLLLPLLLLRLRLKYRWHPRALKFWHERLGLSLRPVPQHSIWIHAVSVGETVAAIPLVKGLRQRFPHIPIVVSSETITGAECVQANLGDQVSQLYFPYDLPAVLRRFLLKLKPRLLILLERELWPNLLANCRSHGIPVVLANARLSARAVRAYQRVLSVAREMCTAIDLVLAHAAADAQRFIDLGLAQDRICVTGSIKFELELPLHLYEQAEQLRAHYWGGRDRPVWIAASTHPGEEEQVLEAFQRVRRQFPDVLLVSVPRHVERVPSLQRLYETAGLSLLTRSEYKPCSPNTDIFIGDTMGELLLFYAAADLAFVGGSLVAKGGQNPVEPAAVGLPILIGPHTFNFEFITEQLRQRELAVRVNDAQELAEQVIHWLANPQKRQTVGHSAKGFVQENRGSLAKHIEQIGRFLEVQN